MVLIIKVWVLIIIKCKSFKNLEWLSKGYKMYLTGNPVIFTNFWEGSAQSF